MGKASIIERRHRAVSIGTSVCKALLPGPAAPGAGAALGRVSSPSRDGSRLPGPGFLPADLVSLALGFFPQSCWGLELLPIRRRKVLAGQLEGGPPDGPEEEGAC